MTADGDELPNPTRVVRFVPYGRMNKDENDNFLGPLPSAFEQRDAEDYLSVTWCEYYNGTADQQLRCAVEALRNSRTVGGKACFCVASTSDVLGAIADRGRRGRALFHPEDDNPAHAGVYGVNPEDKLLLARLAEEEWSNYLTKHDADALSISDCEKSADVG